MNAKQNNRERIGVFLEKKLSCSFDRVMSVLKFSWKTREIFSLLTKDQKMHILIHLHICILGYTLNICSTFGTTYSRVPNISIKPIIVFRIFFPPTLDFHLTN